MPEESARSRSRATSCRHQRPDAYDVTRGIAEVYDPNPIENPNKVEAAIFNLPGNLHLYGRYAEVHTNPILGDVVGTRVGNLEEYRFFDAPPFQRAHTNETSAYNTINKCKQYINALGFGVLMNFGIWVDALGTPFLTSAYDQNLRRLYLDPSFQDAEDSDVVMHEYGHAIHHDIGGSGIFGYPFSCCDDALDEGSVDYLALSANNDIELGEQSGSPNPEGYVRRLSNSRNAVDNLSVNGHNYGTIWASALWHLRLLTGKQVTDSLALQYVYHILPTDTFNTALESAFLPADQDLYNGIHTTQIRDAMSLFKIYGSNPGYQIHTDWIQSDMPYGNDTNATFSTTLPGATSGIAVTFDGNTSFGDNGDTLSVRDGANNLIGTYTGEQLRGATLNIANSDTVQLVLTSIPSDGYSGHGFNLANIAPLNAPGAQPPSLTVDLSTIEGMDPQPVAIEVLGANLVAIRIDMADGTVYFPPPSSPRVKHVFNRDLDPNYADTVGPGPIVSTTTFPVTVTATNSAGLSTTVVRQVTVHPHREVHHTYTRTVPPGKIPENP